MSKSAKLIIIIGVLLVIIVGLVLLLVFYWIPAPQKGMSCEDALEKAQAQEDISQTLRENPNMKITCDSQDENGWLIHVYEIVQEDSDMPSHSATYGWYLVTPDGNVENYMF